MELNRIGDNLEKDPAVLNMLEKLRAALGSDFFDIVDHWPSDSIAVGVASPKNHDVLVYIAIFDDGYHVELELPPDPNADFPYQVAGRHSKLSFAQLVDVAATHLSDGSITMNNKSANKDSS